MVPTPVANDSEDIVSVVRGQETELGIEGLDKAITAWLDRQDRKDLLNQFKTVRLTLRTQLGALIRELRTVFKKRLESAVSRGDVYALCRLTDKRLLWIERLWRYFQEKLDQRENPVYREILAAADEVVWSCYAQPFRSTDTPTRSVPLPWITPEYSPRAIGRSEVPKELKSGVDAEFLAEMLRELPVPLVGLPPQCVAEPWWLIYLAHEVGHHVQADLLPKRQLEDDFREVIRAAVPGDGERWQYRGNEIFADVYSLYMTGSWALWALTELEWTTDSAMVDDTNAVYPAPQTRLALMQKVIDLMPLKGSQSALRGFTRVASNAAGDQDAIVASIANAVVTKSIAGGKTFEKLTRWQASAHEGKRADVPEWKATYLAAGGMTPRETLDGARLALAGGVAAWAEISLDRSAASRATRKETLARNLLKAITACHEPIERAAKEELPAATEASQPLRRLLFESNPERLGSW